MGLSWQLGMRPSSWHLGVKPWLIIASYEGNGHYRHTENARKSLILANRQPIRPRLPSTTSRTNPRKKPHGRTFPVQEHHAPQGAAGRPEVKAVRQAGARNHVRREDGPARPRHECAAARRDHLRPAGDHASG